MCIRDRARNCEIPPVLVFIQNIYAGNIHSNDYNPTGKRRRAYYLDLHGKKCLQLLYDVIPFLIVKKEQAVLVYDYIRGVSQLTEAELCARLTHLKLLTSYQDIQVRSEQLSEPYISGLVDAEGSIGIQRSTTLTVKITQKSSPELLERIRERYGWQAAVYKGTEIKVCGPSAESFLQAIKEWSVVKRLQIDTALKIRQYSLIKFWNRTRVDNDEIDRLKVLITADKHC